MLHYVRAEGRRDESGGRVQGTGCRRLTYVRAGEEGRERRQGGRRRALEQVDLPPPGDCHLVVGELVAVSRYIAVSRYVAVSRYIAVGEDDSGGEGPGGRRRVARVVDVPVYACMCACVCVHVVSHACVCMSLV